MITVAKIIEWIGYTKEISYSSFSNVISFFLQWFDGGSHYFPRLPDLICAGHKVAPNTGANETKFFTLATKS